MTLILKYQATVTIRRDWCEAKKDLGWKCDFQVFGTQQELDYELDDPAPVSLGSFAFDSNIHPPSVFRNMIGLVEHFNGILNVRKKDSVDDPVVLQHLDYLDLDKYGLRTSKISVCENSTVEQTRFIKLFAADNNLYPYGLRGMSQERQYAYKNYPYLVFEEGDEEWRDDPDLQVVSTCSTTSDICD